MFARSRRSGAVRLFTVYLAASFGLRAGSARAAEYTWVGGSGPGGGSFSDPANWTPAGGPPGAADTAIYHGVSAPSRAASPIGGLELHGSVDYTVGVLDVTGTSPSAFLISADLTLQKGSVFDVEEGAVARVLNGGVLMIDPAWPQRRAGLNLIQMLPGSSFVADALSCLNGDIDISLPLVFPGHNLPGGRLRVNRDLVLGHADAPASARAADPLARVVSGGNVTVGGAARVYPDGFFYVDNATVTGGVVNTGTVRVTNRLNGDLTNAGILLTDPFAGYAAEAQSTLAGRFIQSADGILDETINSGALLAPLVVDGDTVELGGTVALTTSDPGSVHVGDRFHLIETDGPVVFTAAFAPDPAGITYAPQLVPGEGLYALVVAVPEPTFAFMAVPGAASLLRRRRRPA